MCFDILSTKAAKCGSLDMCPDAKSDTCSDISPGICSDSVLLTCVVMCAPAKGIAIRNKKLLFLWRRDKIEGTTDGLDALR